MKRNVLFIMAFVAVVMFGALPAHALSILSISDGSTTITVDDQDFIGGGGKGIDGSAVLGKIFYSTPIGVFDISVNIAVTKPVQGSATLPVMGLHVVATSTGAGVLTVQFLDTDFWAPPSHPGWMMAIGGSAGGTVDYETWISGSNSSALLPAGPGPAFTKIGALGPFSGPGFGTGGFVSFPNPVALAGAYSLVQKVVITHTGAAVTSADADLTTPEPTTILLLGTGLLGMGLWGRRRKKNV